MSDRLRRTTILLLILLGAPLVSSAQEGDAPSPPAGVEAGYDRAHVGEELAGRIVVPTNQVLSPLGKQVALSSRPTDVALSPDGRWLAVLGNRGLTIVGAEDGKIAGTASFAGSYAGVVFTADGKRVLASNMLGSIGVYALSERGSLTALHSIPLSDVDQPTKANTVLPVGLALDAKRARLWVALNVKNALAEVDLAKGEVVREIAVGNAPYGVALLGDKAYVSNWAGRMPRAGEPSGPSGRAAPVRVDPRTNVANDGSVSVVDLVKGVEIKQIPVGLHPSGIVVAAKRQLVCVANANSDTVSLIDAAKDEVVETLSTRPADKLLFGSAPNALALSADAGRLYVSNGGNNAVGVIELAPPHSKLLGCIPTGWYPAGLVLDAARQRLCVANVKGTGSRNTDWEGKRKIKDKIVFGYNSHDHSGTVSLAKLPAPGKLAALTQGVLENNRQTVAISALAPPRADQPPLPVPLRHGEPSVFKHVLYIIKENRTYDQVLGDVKRGEGSPELCIFGGDVSPNHHALADQYGLLDNFYCSGVLSADGHQWTDEALATDYLEKGFAAFPRSYPYDGNDALAYASSGFLWDNALAHKQTLRIYGEFVKAAIHWKDAARKEKPTYLDCYRDFVDKRGAIEVKATATIKTLEPHLCPTAIGFPLTVPDVHRAEQFIHEMNDYERRGDLPNLMIMSLPGDHTSGTNPGIATPAAAVADNDLALGRIVEAVSHSKFWPETCIFVVEDDPQNGFDHIDGHRTVALAISAYSSHTVVSTNYNQTSMVRTIELILGLPPMNQFDASATPMYDCFTAKPENKPYTVLPNKIPLDQLNPKVADIRDRGQRHWAEVSAKMPLDEADEIDEDQLNRVLWHAMRGRDDTYPKWAVLDDDDAR